MNSNFRMPLVLACVLVAALEAPRAMHVFVEDMSGPYEGRALAVASNVRAANEGARSDALPLVCEEPQRAEGQRADGAEIARPSVSRSGPSHASHHAVDRSVARATR